MRIINALFLILTGFWLSTFHAFAHEVRPAIADITLQQNHVELSITLNLEALLADIDLHNLENTDDATTGAEDYTRLRALIPEELEFRLREAWPRIEKGIHIISDEKRLPLSLTKVLSPETGDVNLPRESRLTISATAEGPVSVGWDKRYGQIILRQQAVEDPEAAYTGLLSGGEMSPPLTYIGGQSEGAAATLLRYIAVGFDHIVPKGLDHILFVLGLFFLAPYLGPLLWQVSAFTLAHTITLALGAQGVVVVPGNIVEPLIAASIVYVAVENIFFKQLNWWRPALIFGFGLLHGLGFASVLDEFGLPEGQFVPALIGFNIGVEVGQLAVLAVAFGLVGFWFRHKAWYHARIAVPASLMIAAVGLFWVVERVFL